MNKNVFIILVNYNGALYTIDCCKSLKELDYKNFSIIVVDNKSKAEDISLLKDKLDKDIMIIESSINGGFAAGNNIGIEYALQHGADYVLLLNNDTLVESNFLTKLVNEAEKDVNVGICGSKIMYYPKIDTIWYGGGAIDWALFVGKHYGEKSLESKEYNSKKYVDFVTGCTMLIKKQVFEQVGLLDESYFMYFEDVDFCVKAAEKNYKMIYVPESIVYHKVSVSSGGEQSPFILRLSNKNRRVFMKRYRYKVSNIKYVKSVSYFYLTRLIKIVIFLMKGDLIRAKAILNGLLEARK